MTALQLNAEIYRAMGEIADNETLLAKVLGVFEGISNYPAEGNRCIRPQRMGCGR